MAPEIGQVTEAVASSPTAPATGVQLVQRTEKVYDGLADEAAAVPFGLTIIVTAVEPTSGNTSASICEYCWCMSIVTLLSNRPETRVTEVEPNAVVGTSAALVVRVNEATEVEMSTPFSVTLTSVRTCFARSF